jgi:prepilin-type N-terminal cleavage/methylation domain-containing protein
MAVMQKKSRIALIPCRAHGYTLIELMVSTVLAAIIMMGVSGMLIENTRFDSREKSRLVLLREAREAVSVFGDGMLDASGTFQSGFRAMNPAPDSVGYYVNNNIAPRAPQTQIMYLSNVTFDNDVSGYGKTMTVEFTDPDLNARLGTNVVHEEFWCFFANNVGARMQ